MTPADLPFPRTSPIAALRGSILSGLLGLVSPSRVWTILAPRAGEIPRTGRTFSLRLAPLEAPRGGTGPGDDRAGGGRGRGFDGVFDPGQYVLLSFPGRGLLSTPRPFTVASSPTETRYIEIVAKDSGTWSGAAKELVASVRPGARVEAALRGPFGTFSYLEAPGTGRYVFLAGGIGVTPFLSMVRYMAHSDRDRRVLLVWGARTRDDLLGLDCLADATRALSRFRVVPVLSHDPLWTGERGRLDEEKLGRLVPAFFSAAPEDFEWNSASYRLCGPGTFNRDLTAALRRFGVSGAAIHEARFSL